METYFVNLLGQATEKHDYEMKDENEPTIYNLSPTQLECVNKLRSKCNTFRQTVKRGLKNQQQQMMNTEKIIKQLSKDKSIIITRPDKGRGIVILNRNDYNKKMNDILSDPTTFEEIHHDPTMKHENKLNAKLLELKNSGFLTPEDYQYAKSRGSQPGRIYGLPKIHKKRDPDGLYPLRPIVSSSNTYNYRLAKLLANKLNHIRQSNNITKDTFSFVDWLHKLDVDPNDFKMLSFDITSLFTKVPLNQTIGIILNKLYGQKHTCTFSKKPKSSWCHICKHRVEMETIFTNIHKRDSLFIQRKIFLPKKRHRHGQPIRPVICRHICELP